MLGPSAYDVASSLPLQEPLYTRELGPDAVRTVLRGNLVEFFPRLTRQPPSQSLGYLAVLVGLLQSVLRLQEFLP